MPPMMVAPERLVPGISANACAMPSLSASSGRQVVEIDRRAADAAACRCRCSTQKMISPPTMNASATGTGLNRWALIVPAEEHPEHRRRQEGDQHVEREAALATGSLRDSPPTVRPILLAVVPDDGEHRAGLDRDVEQLGLLVGPAEQGAGEDQVPGAGDGQELGQPFDDAEDEGLDQQRQRVEKLHAAAYYATSAAPPVVKVVHRTMARSGAADRQADRRQPVRR